MVAGATKQNKKSRTQKRAKRTRRRLKKAALDIFSEKPVDSVTVEEITEKADVGKGTLYRHFADKDEIIVVLVDDAVDHLVERIRDYSARPDALEDMLRHILDAHYRFSVDSKEEFILLFQGKLLARLQADTLEDIDEPYLRYLEEIENQVSTYLSPSIDPMKIRRLACAVAGFVFGFFSFAMIGMNADEIETSIKPLRWVFVRSLCEFLGR
ncbi:MAG: TetR/AcrR family transcriptional regulator [Sedimentisphaerales bacterium]|nr:TetR/AcrR family transcriptional regulator [Sedimentisphaerales bacterium]